jgi:DNA-binding NtrC family response regulator
MSQKSVLHLDDEAEIRSLVALGLERKGYAMTGAESPREVLKLLDGGLRPDLFICDFNLTESDGIEAIREFKRRLPEVPVILLTGVLIDPRVAEKTFGDLVSVYLEKPAALKRLTEDVRRLIG